MPHLIRVTPGVRLILVGIVTASVVQWMVQAFGHWPLWEKTVCSGEALKNLEIWRAVSYPFSYEPGMALSLLFHSLLLWMVGSAVEREIGTRRFYVLFGACALVGALGSLGTGPAVLAGALVPLVGVELAFCVVHPYSTVTPIPNVSLRASFAGFIVIAFQVVANQHLALPLVLSMVCAYVAIVQRWGSATATAPPRRFGQAAAKPKSRLASIGKVQNKVTPLRPENAAPKAASPSEIEVDRILDKLRDEGMGALSPQERETLDLHSSQLRQRDGI